MNAEQMIRETHKHFDAVRTAINNHTIQWTPEPTLEGLSAYHGLMPGYLIVVVRGPDNATDGSITTQDSFFAVIHLTQEMAKLCFAAAEAGRSTPQ